jgi:hypothetical protein
MVVPESPLSVPGPVEVYMVLEPDSEEILSGIHLEIIAAATSLIQVRIDGQPVIELNTKTSWRTRIRQWLWPSKHGTRIIGYGPDELFRPRDKIASSTGH